MNINSLPRPKSAKYFRSVSQERQPKKYSKTLPNPRSNYDRSLNRNVYCPQRIYKEHLWYPKCANQVPSKLQLFSRGQNVPPLESKVKDLTRSNKHIGFIENLRTTSGWNFSHTFGTEMECITIGFHPPDRNNVAISTLATHAKSADDKDTNEKANSYSGGLPCSAEEEFLNADLNRCKIVGEFELLFIAIAEAHNISKNNNLSSTIRRKGRLLEKDLSRTLGVPYSYQDYQEDQSSSVSSLSSYEENEGSLSFPTLEDISERQQSPITDLLPRRKLTEDCSSTCRPSSRVSVSSGGTMQPDFQYTLEIESNSYKIAQKNEKERIQQMMVNTGQSFVQVRDKQEHPLDYQQSVHSKSSGRVSQNLGQQRVQNKCPNLGQLQDNQDYQFMQSQLEDNLKDDSSSESSFTSYEENEGWLECPTLKDKSGRQQPFITELPLRRKNVLEQQPTEECYSACRPSSILNVSSGGTMQPRSQHTQDVLDFATINIQKREQERMENNNQSLGLIRDSQDRQMVDKQPVGSNFYGRVSEHRGEQGFVNESPNLGQVRENPDHQCMPSQLQEMKSQRNCDTVDETESGQVGVLTHVPQQITDVRQELLFAKNKIAQEVKQRRLQCLSEYEVSLCKDIKQFEQNLSTIEQDLEELEKYCRPFEQELTLFNDHEKMRFQADSAMDKHLDLIIITLNRFKKNATESIIQSVSSCLENLSMKSTNMKSGDVLRGDESTSPSCNAISTDTNNAEMFANITDTLSALVGTVKQLQDQMFDVQQSIANGIESNMITGEPPQSHQSLYQRLKCRLLSRFRRGKK